MTKALTWIRKSKGEDDDIGLQEQRRKVAALADELAADIDTLDLGVQTGFSSLTRDGEGLLDDRADVADAVERLRAGDYDYLVALDDERVCRDGYFEVIRHAATEGGCQLTYVRDVPDDDLTHDIKRRVERDTKEEEIEKSRQAIEARQAKGYDHGRPKFGMEYDDDGHYQVPGEDFDTVRDILRRREAGESLPQIAEAVDEALATVASVCDRREWYADRGQLKPQEAEADADD